MQGVQYMCDLFSLGGIKVPATALKLQNIMMRVEGNIYSNMPS